MILRYTVWTSAGTLEHRAHCRHGLIWGSGRLFAAAGPCIVVTVDTCPKVAAMVAAAASDLRADDDGTVFVIHAGPFGTEKRHFRRRWR